MVWLVVAPRICFSTGSCYRSHSRNWKVIWRQVSEFAKKNIRTISNVGLLRNTTCPGLSWSRATSKAKCSTKCPKHAMTSAVKSLPREGHFRWWKEQCLKGSHVRASRVPSERIRAVRNSVVETGSTKGGVSEQDNVNETLRFTRPHFLYQR
jgi:hypothetical protein